MRSFLLIMLIVALTGSGYFVYDRRQNFKAAEAIRLAEDEKSLRETEKSRAAIKVLQKSHIDSFKADLKKTAQDYKDYTKILVEIVRPQNFSSAAYAKENYILFTQDIEPTIRKKADAILGVFTRYRKTLESTIDEESTETEKRFIAEWIEMHDVQLERSVTLLTEDDKLLQAYRDLIEFYYVHSKLYSVDIDAEEFVFKREKDERKHEKLRNIIQDIRRHKASMRQKE